MFTGGQPVVRTLHVLSAPRIVTAVNSMLGMRGPRHSGVEGLIRGPKPKCGADP